MGAMIFRKSRRNNPVLLVLLTLGFALWLLTLFTAHRRARLQVSASNLPPTRHVEGTQAYERARSSHVPSTLPDPDDDGWTHPEVVDLYNRMTIEERVGQLIMISVHAVQV